MYGYYFKKRRMLLLSSAHLGDREFLALTSLEYLVIILKELSIHFFYL